MTQSDLKSILSRHNIFSCLSSEKLDQAVQAIRVKDYEKGKHIFWREEKADKFFLVITGCVALTRTSSSGNDAIVAFMGQGDAFAEAVALAETVYPVNSVVVSDAKVAEIPTSMVKDMIRQDTSVALKIIGSVSAKNHNLVGRIEQLSLKSAPQRLGEFFLKLSGNSNQDSTDVVLPYDKSLIATFLGMKPETFSRALSTLKKHGVTTNGKLVSIASLQQLEDFCE